MNAEIVYPLTEEQRQAIASKTWTTGAGKALHLETEVADRHLDNLIKFFERKLLAIERSYKIGMARFNAAMAHEPGEIDSEDLYTYAQSIDPLFEKVLRYQGRYDRAKTWMSTWLKLATAERTRRERLGIKIREYNAAAPAPAPTPAFDPVEALTAVASVLYAATLVGSPATRVKSIYEWMKKPTPGALVIEISTWFSRRDPRTRVGILERVERKFVCTHEHNDVNHPGCKSCSLDERWYETYTWVHTLDRNGATHHRWHNCRFLRIPRTVDEAVESEG